MEVIRDGKAMDVAQFVVMVIMEGYTIGLTILVTEDPSPFPEDEPAQKNKSDFWQSVLTSVDLPVRFSTKGRQLGLIQGVPVPALYTFSVASFDKLTCKLKDDQPFNELTTLIRDPLDLILSKIRDVVPPVASKAIEAVNMPPTKSIEPSKVNKKRKTSDSIAPKKAPAKRGFRKVIIRSSESPESPPTSDQSSKLTLRAMMKPRTPKDTPKTDPSSVASPVPSPSKALIISAPNLSPVIPASLIEVTAELVQDQPPISDSQEGIPTQDTSTNVIEPEENLPLALTAIASGIPASAPQEIPTPEETTIQELLSVQVPPTSQIITALPPSTSYAVPNPSA
ncbi:pollen-specific leucine-rich repeat extensin-like protein 2 [Syzygium oleosum]|uniref:pollen-specific leucine-rich repeat extensin-like protein 2 n=1 Tax=Syzygium oleosum TaxID=219896 RepID=UPI0024BB16C8|nr:pollen-specific leucine-rich repeat extensin-like protein 2 [Syzygium oleosum]